MVQSAALTTEQWTTKLPPDQFGQWRWSVVVVSYGDVVAESAEGMFWFNPFPKEPPIITVTPTPAMATPTAWVPVPSPTWPLTPLAKISDAASLSPTVGTTGTLAFGLLMVLLLMSLVNEGLGWVMRRGRG